MLETSQDILYLVISFCVLLFTGFLVWIMYYLAQIMKQSNEVIADVRKKLDELTETIETIKNKVISSATSITFVASQIKDIVNFVKDKKANKKNRTRKKKK